MTQTRRFHSGIQAIAAAAMMIVLAARLHDASAGEAAPAVAAERTVDGVRLMALAPENNARFDISVLPPAEGVDRMEAALRLIERRSPATASTIGRLKAAGRVSLIYYPNGFRDRTRLNTQTVALFLPGFLKQRGLVTDGREFAVVINQFGIKWPPAELAAIIAHELAGHGVQHLEERITSARLLDLECEASLYQEQAYQDLGVPKKSRTVVLFRRQMEFHYCADFRRYMNHRMPRKLALWDSLDPDVAALLATFQGYRGTQSATFPGSSRPSVSSRNR